jgi:hypothetical protein
VPELEILNDYRLADGRTMGEVAHIVHVYTVEAHPALPAPTPYKQWTFDDLPEGGPGDTSYGNTRQAYTYEDRVANAEQVLTLVETEPRLLIDALGTGVASNPVWCTYGTAPNAAFVISQDGTIVLAQLWTEVASLRQALLDELFGTP